MSRRVRDAVHAAVFTPDVTGSSTPSADNTDEARVPATAARLGALPRQTPSPAFSPAETGLLEEWLDRLSNSAADEPQISGGA